MKRRLFKVVDSKNGTNDVKRYFETKKEAKKFRDEQNEIATKKGSMVLSTRFKVNRDVDHWKGASLQVNMKKTRS